MLKYLDDKAKLRVVRADADMVMHVPFLCPLITVEHGLSNND